MMVVLGLPLALPIAVIGFFFGFIPYVGNLLATVLALLVAIAVGDTSDIVLMLVFTVVFNIAQGNFVTPLVYGKSLSLHPAIVLMAIPVGNEIAGILGMFLVVPAAAIIAATWRLVIAAIDEAGLPPNARTPRMPERRRRRGSCRGHLNPAAWAGPPGHLIGSRRRRAGTLGRVSHHRSVSAATARRFLVRRHLLAPPRSLPPEPASVMRVIDRLGSLQFDPLEVAGRNHDLTLLARVAGYRRAWTDGLLYRDRVLYETFNKMLSLVPTAELPWYRITWDRMHAEHTGGPFDDHAPLVEELLARIRADGPLSSTDVEAAGGHRLVLAAHEPGPGDPRGARRGRDPGHRPARGQPARLRPGGAAVPRGAARRAPPGARAAAAQAAVALSRQRPAGGVRGLLDLDGDRRRGDAERRSATSWSRSGRSSRWRSRGSRARGSWWGTRCRCWTAAEAEVAAGRPMDGAGAVFLAPLDPLAWDRDLLLRLWGFDYRWEVYVPAAKRRWGYYVLPLLYGDRFVGRIEPRIDRRTGTLRVLGLWWEDGFEPLSEGDPGLPRCVHRGDPGAHGLRGPVEGGDAQGRTASRASQRRCGRGSEAAGRGQRA